MNPNTLTCVPCPVGYYQESNKQFVCVECPAGRKFTVGTGSTSFSDCKGRVGLTFWTQHVLSWYDKTNKVSVLAVKTQISLGIRPVWSESLLCAQWVAKDPSFLHVDSEDSDQTGRMHRLIWVFAGCTTTLLVLSCRGSTIWLFFLQHIQA